MTEVVGLDALLSAEGWPYASSLPVEEGDLGRYNALFGRDSLITALAVLPQRPDVARATLRALAALQGRVEDSETDEQPGKIIHEWWPETPAHVWQRLGWPVRDGELRHYGSADATAWFLVVLASLDEPELSAELESTWRGAGDWLEGALERGQGFVRYGPRRAPGGLSQQGWRDSSHAGIATGHGIAGADGRAPEAPVADADCQAVAVVGLRALAALSGKQHHRRLAPELAARVEGVFGPEIVALEADGTPVRGPGSQLGWLLWSEALGCAAATRVADRLCRADVLTSFGLRTLSERHPVHRPDAYHRGAVWPFDSWLGWAGLRAAGRAEDAEHVRSGVLAALDRLGHAPELYAVGAQGPARIAVANLVQAWTVGARWALEHEWDGRSPVLFGEAGARSRAPVYRSGPVDSDRPGSLASGARPLAR